MATTQERFQAMTHGQRVRLEGLRVTRWTEKEWSVETPSGGRATGTLEEVAAYFDVHAAKLLSKARTPGQGMNWIRLSTRMAIYHRDGFACVYCKATAEEHGVGLTLDHVRSAEYGGDNRPSNLVTACLSCNSSRQDTPMTVWLAALPEAAGRRVRNSRRRKLDRAEGRRLARLRKEG